MRQFVLISLLIALAASSRADDYSPVRKIRRPVAVVLSADGNGLLVANGRSGTVSRIDVASRRVAGEFPVAQQLADLVALGDGRYAAVDVQACQLILLAERNRELVVLGRAPTNKVPVSIAPLSGGRGCVVASLWAQRLEVFDTAAHQPRRQRFIDLPFAPRAQRLLPDGKRLVVAAAFGGRIAVVDLAAERVVALSELDGHNIRHITLATGGQSLLVPQQVLDPRASTTADHVHWGGVMQNVVREITLSELLGHSPPRTSSRNATYLGDPSRATGDPCQVLVTRVGTQVLSVSGTSEVDITDRGNNFHRIRVGRRPTAMALSRDQSEVYVACTSDDLVAVLDVDQRRLLETIPLGPTVEPDEFTLGELLFYDSTLASDGWYSCHSCHTDGHSTGQTNDNSSDYSFGAPKRILSLLGTRDTGPWAWNGEVDLLDTQIRNSITKTMRGARPTNEQVAALSWYLRSFEPPPSVADARGTRDEAAIARGREVFGSHGCVDCHTGYTYTNAGTFDVGLSDEQGGRRFNPPSLRGVSQRTRLFHDNRAASLGEVFTKHRHPDGNPPAAAELENLLKFLQSL